jgi:prepilin-type processing-associated H-X9-DG protein
MKVSRGVSLVELFVVIAIIGILVSLVLSGVLAAREQARSLTCQNNLRQIAIAVSDSISRKRVLPTNHFTFRSGISVAERMWLEDVEEVASICSICPTDRRQLMLENLPPVFNSLERNFRANSMDYVGCGGINSIVEPFEELLPSRERIGIFTDSFKQSHRSLDSSITKGYSNMILLWESAASRKLGYPIHGVVNNSSDWLDVFETRSIRLVSDFDSNESIRSVSALNTLKYLQTERGLAIGRLGFIDRSGMPMDLPIGMTPVSSSLINVTNMLRAPYALHSNYCNFAFADCSIRRIPTATAARVLFSQSLLQR